jgi:hypothetical protein
MILRVFGRRRASFAAAIAFFSIVDELALDDWLHLLFGGNIST